MKNEQVMTELMAQVADKETQIESLVEDIATLQSKSEITNGSSPVELSEAIAMRSQVGSIKEFNAMKDLSESLAGIDSTAIVAMTEFLGERTLDEVNESLTQLEAYTALGTVVSINERLNTGVTDDLMDAYKSTYDMVEAVGGSDELGKILDETQILIDTSKQLMAGFGVDTIDAAITRLDEMKADADADAALVAPYESIDNLIKVANLAEQLVDQTRATNELNERQELIKELNATADTVEWLDDLHENDGIDWTTIGKIARTAVGRNSYRPQPASGLSYLMSATDKKAAASAQAIDDGGDLSESLSSRAPRTTLQGLFNINAK